MIKPEKPSNEAARLKALHGLSILDSGAEQAFDDLVALAAAVCNVPMGSVTLIDEDRQWFKARLGIGVSETPRDLAFCAHGILAPDAMLVVRDTLDDPRFRDNPFVSGEPNIRFYAGAPLLAREGEAIGMVCVMDVAPRDLEPAQRDALQALARQASLLMDSRRINRELSLQLEERRWYEEQLLRYQAALESQNESLAEQTRTDPLTGLANRRAFARTLEAALSSAVLRRVPLHVAMIDIDHFKHINDQHGHAEGDRVLRAVSGALHGHTAARGRVARYGGEEFVLLLYDIAPEQASMHMEHLRSTIAGLPLGLPLTVSIGLAGYRDGDGSAALLARADEALYEAKRAGRDRVILAA